MTSSITRQNGDPTLTINAPRRSVMINRVRRILSSKLPGARRPLFDELGEQIARARRRRRFLRDQLVDVQLHLDRRLPRHAGKIAAPVDVREHLREGETRPGLQREIGRRTLRHRRRSHQPLARRLRRVRAPVLRGDRNRRQPARPRHAEELMDELERHQEAELLQQIHPPRPAPRASTPDAPPAP